MNANIAFMQNTKGLSMSDLSNGLGFAFTKGGGLLLNLLGWLGSFSLNLLSVDINFWLTAIPAFFGAVSAVGIGAWHSWKKKLEDLEERREKRALDTMRALQSNGTITPDMTAEQRFEVLHEFRKKF